MGRYDLYRETINVGNGKGPTTALFSWVTREWEDEIGEKYPHLINSWGMFFELGDQIFIKWEDVLTIIWPQIKKFLWGNQGEC